MEFLDIFESRPLVFTQFEVYDFILSSDINSIKVRPVCLISSLSLATISESTITSGKKTLKNGFQLTLTTTFDHSGTLNLFKGIVL